jgi:hypothetical protein
LCHHSNCYRSSSSWFLSHIRFMKLLSHHQGSFISPWSCPTVSALLPTCVSPQRTQKWRLSGLFSLPLYASLGAEPRPWVTYTHIVPRLGPRQHRLCNGHITASLAVPLWHVTADWELRCNQPQVPWNCAGLFPPALSEVGGHGRLFPW